MGPAVKRYIIPIIVVFALASGIVLGCSTSALPSERDQAITFYRGIYPIYMEFFNTIDKWNTWKSGASPQEYTRNLYNVAGYSQDKLETLSNQVEILYAPPQLSKVKDTIVSAMNKLIEYFILVQEYAHTGQNSYRIQAEVTWMEYSKLLGTAKDAWEDGIARYNIQQSEIIK